MKRKWFRCISQLGFTIVEGEAQTAAFSDQKRKISTKQFRSRLHSPNLSHYDAYWLELVVKILLQTTLRFVFFNAVLYHYFVFCLNVEWRARARERERERERETPTSRHILLNRCKPSITHCLSLSSLTPPTQLPWLWLSGGGDDDDGGCWY